MVGGHGCSAALSGGYVGALYGRSGGEARPLHGGGAARRQLCRTRRALRCRRHVLGRRAPAGRRCRRHLLRGCETTCPTAAAATAAAAAAAAATAVDKRVQGRIQLHVAQLGRDLAAISPGAPCGAVHWRAVH